jgi:TolA-binding protein
MVDLRRASVFVLKTLLTWLILASSTLLSAQEPKTGKQPVDKTAASSPEAVNMFTDAANFQNEGAFALAVEEWEKFIKQFPRDPLIHKARHYAGVCHLQLKQLDRAARQFQAVLAESPDFELAEDALLNLGWCQFSLAARTDQALLAKSGDTFTAYLQKFPQGKYADQAWYFLAESRYQRGEKQQAVQVYRQLLDKHPASPLRSSGFYGLGVTLEELGQHPEAGRVFDQLLNEFPKHDLATEVRMRKGETLLQTGAIQEAEKIFSEVAAVPGFESADHALNRQAFCALKQNRFADAGKLYAELATRFPKSHYTAEAVAAAGRCYYSAEKYSDAAPWLQESIELGGREAAEAAHWLCRIYLRQKDSKKVVELAESVLSKGAEGPYRVHLQMDQADALYELSEWRGDALDRYLEIASQHPQHELAPQALYNAAFAALELKRFADGIQHASSFLEKYPRDALVPDTRFVSAECQLLQGKYPEAEQAWRGLLGQFAEHREADAWRLRLGLTLYLQKKYAEVPTALGTLAAAAKQPNQAAEARYLVGASHIQRHEYAAAAKALEASLAASPRWRQADETMLFLASAQRGLNQLDAARSTLQQLIREFPDSEVLDQAHYRLGEYESAAGDHAAAARSFQQVISAYGSSPLAAYAAYGKGSAQLKAKDFAGADATFTSMLAQFGDHALAADARLARGMSRRQAGQAQPAIDDFSAYLQTNPPQPRRSDALYERGLAEVALENFSAAAETFQGIVRDNPKYALMANVLYELGWAYRKGNRAAESLGAFRRLAQEHGSSDFGPEAWFHVGEDAYERQQWPEAIAAYQQARQKGQAEIAEKAAHKIGWTQFKLGQMDDAAGQFAEQLAKFPAGRLANDARFMRAECLFKLTRYSEALPAFREAIENPSQTPEMFALAFLHGGQSSAQLKQWQESLSLLDQFAARFPESAYLPEAIYERGWARQNLNQLDEALADYESAAGKSRGEVGARARFMIGQIQFERKQHDEAVKSFLRVMYGFGGENAADEVKKWQATAGFEAGRCAEVQLRAARDPQQKAKLLQDARTYYRFVTERHASHSLAGQAQARLAALSKL